VLGSYLADRLGLGRVLVASLLATAAALWGFVELSGAASQAALIIGGFFLGPSHTLLLVSGQRRFPQRMAMASGVFLGFGFVSGAAGTWLLGLLADRTGLASTLRLVPVIVLANALLALLVTIVGRPASEPAEVQASVAHGA